MLDAYLEKRLGEYYQYVASSDKAIKSLDSLQAEFAPTSSDLVTDFLFSHTRYQVDSTAVLDDSALVYVTSTSPDVGWVLQQAYIVERDLGSETEMGMKLSILSERYKLGGGPKEENGSVFHLVREDLGWKVIVGWADMPVSEDQGEAAAGQ